MEAHTCNHPKVPHTVVWWPNDGDHIPTSRGFDDLEDADHFTQKLIRTSSERIGRLKIARTDNETYVCYTWENPEKKNVADAGNIKMEIDMEPMKDVFDNISLGFENHGKAIRGLRMSQAAIGFALLVSNVAWYFVR